MASQPPPQAVSTNPAAHQAAVLQPQQPPLGPQQQQQQQQQQDFDPVHRFKMLIPQLKESLQSVMSVASQNFAHNTSIDNGVNARMYIDGADLTAANVTNQQCIKSNDGTVQRFDKSLEEFYALCDQLELCLRLAHECLSQSIDSAKHSPNLVPTATKPDTVQTESLSYSQYLSMIKSQISCAKDIHNALLECSKKIAGKTQQAIL
ncbi:mediator of RNA polymerase II transcription subunit 29 isoform X1 [Pygocentrus nattereri]|uniref:Mediator of RNA polymerase II transcription subunit 29 n=1 Tax=Pygocentrus nattereri TaxID=42514 RepID=A0AAR2JVZ5_PYGNA|nr:mediator of RNA polymerase II transcription subunit 29 isoform X1 [Pygocentrus nattereri]